MIQQSDTTAVQADAEQPEQKILSEKEQNCYRKKSGECVSYGDLMTVEEKQLVTGNRVFIQKKTVDNDVYYLLGKVILVKTQRYPDGRTSNSYDIELTNGNTITDQYGYTLYLAKNLNEMPPHYLTFALGDYLKGGRKLKKGTTKKRKGTTKKRMNRKN
jgi:hypothetical protein